MHRYNANLIKIIFNIIIQKNKYTKNIYPENYFLFIIK